MKPSTWSSATVFTGAAMAFSAASASGWEIENVTTSAPEDFKKSRRENFSIFMIVSSRHHFGRALHRLDDARVRAAAAQVAGERLPDLVVARALVGREQRGGFHDHAVDAVAALHRLLLDEGLLQRVRPLRGAQPFERDDLLAGGRGHGEATGAHGFSVHVHRTSAALREAAAKARAVEIEIVAQRVEQRHLRIVDAQVVRLAVDGKLNILGHGPFPASGATNVAPPAGNWQEGVAGLQLAKPVCGVSRAKSGGC